MIVLNLDELHSTKTADIFNITYDKNRNTENPDSLNMEKNMSLWM